jgi:hypothetical protein
VSKELMGVTWVKSSEPDRLRSVDLWRPVPGFEWYEVSTQGGVRNTKTGRRLKPRRKWSHSVRYRVVGLSAGGREQKWRLHRLVLTVFRGPCPEGHEAAHLNGDSEDNRLSNLAWVTPEENRSHKRLHGTHIHRCGRCGEVGHNLRTCPAPWPR